MRMGLPAVSPALARRTARPRRWFRAVEPAFDVDFSAYVPSMFAYLGFLLLTFFLSDVYPYRPGRSWIEEVYTIGVAVMARQCGVTLPFRVSIRRWPGARGA